MHFHSFRDFCYIIVEMVFKLEMNLLYINTIKSDNRDNATSFNPEKGKIEDTDLTTFFFIMSDTK